MNNFEHRYLKESEVAKLTKIALQTLRNHRHECRGIPYLKIGRMVRYAFDDVENYMQAKRINPDRD